MDIEALVTKITGEVMQELEHRGLPTCSTADQPKIGGCDTMGSDNNNAEMIAEKVKAAITAECGCATNNSCGITGRMIGDMIDHTLLKPEATRDDVLKLCAEAREHRFASVCVNPVWVATAAEALRGCDVKVCTVIGFPLGANTSFIKAAETRDAVANGADEIDLVINVGALKAHQDEFVENDVRAIVNAAGGRLVKAILETCLLSDEEVVRACKLSVAGGVDFVKTSTGFNKAGATAHHVALMRQTVGSGIGVKASGGIRDYETAVEMIKAGATRIGASASIKIMNGGK